MPFVSGKQRGSFFMRKGYNCLLQYNFLHLMKCLKCSSALNKYDLTRDVQFPVHHERSYSPYGSNHLLRMVMEPEYLAEDVIIHPNHHLTRWLDPWGVFWTISMWTFPLLCLGHQRVFRSACFLVSFPPKQDTRSVHEEKTSNLYTHVVFSDCFIPSSLSVFCNLHGLLKVFFTTGISTSKTIKTYIHRITGCSEIWWSTKFSGKFMKQKSTTQTFSSIFWGPKFFSQF